MNFPIDLRFDVVLPPYYAQLLWLLLLTMVIDLIAGYTNAVIKGVANSNRLREGIVRRGYVLLLLGLLTILFSSIKGVSLQALGYDLHLVHFLFIGSILAELKSIAEKARDLGLGEHPVVKVVLSLPIFPRRESRTKTHVPKKHDEGGNP